MPAPDLLRISAVTARTGHSRAKIYELMARGLFPKQIDLADSPGGGAVAWISTEVDDWIRDRIAKSKAKPITATKTRNDRGANVAAARRAARTKRAKSAASAR